MKQIFVLLLVSIFGHPGKSNHWLVRSPLLLIPRGIASFGARTPPLSGCKRLPDTRATKTKEMLKCHQCEHENTRTRCSEEAYTIIAYYACCLTACLYQGSQIIQPCKT